MPWVERKAINRGGLKGRKRFLSRSRFDPPGYLAAFRPQDVGPEDPGHRPSASALG